MENLEAAWFAGLFEGEGSVTQVTRRNRWNEDIHYFTLKVGMTDEDVIRKIGKVTGYDHIYGPYLPKGGTKPAWVWECQHRAEVERIIRTIRPFMGKRRGARMDQVLAYYAEREARLAKRQIECRQGHDLTTENATYTDSKGSVLCRLCRNVQAKSTYRQVKKDRSRETVVLNGNISYLYVYWRKKDGTRFFINAEGRRVNVALQPDGTFAPT